MEMHQEKGRGSMTFQQLQYVLEVARCGSINKAAQGRFVSQSSISKLLKDLEEELGWVIGTRRVFSSTGTDREVHGNSLSICRP